MKTYIVVENFAVDGVAAHCQPATEALGAEGANDVIAEKWC